MDKFRIVYLYNNKPMRGFLCEKVNDLINSRKRIRKKGPLDPDRFRKGKREKEVSREDERARERERERERDRLYEEKKKDMDPSSRSAIYNR
jgi:hypothetical protein